MAGRLLPGSRGCRNTAPPCGRTAEAPCIAGTPTGSPVRVDVNLPAYGLTAPARGVWVDGDAVDSLIAGGYLTAAPAVP